MRLAPPRRYNSLTCEACNRVIKDGKVAGKNIKYDPDALDLLVEHFRGKANAKKVRYFIII